MPTTNMFPTEVFSIADEMSKRDARYSQYIYFVLLVLFAVWVLKYVVNQNRELITSLQETQTKNQAKLELLMDKLATTVSENSKAYAAFAAALDRNTAILLELKQGYTNKHQS